jgi:hypothetical protein
MNSDYRGFTTFALDSPRSFQTIRRRLEEMKADRTSQLVSAQDWPDYKRRVGVIQGLEEALHVCDEVEKAERA